MNNGLILLLGAGVAAYFLKDKIAGWIDPAAASPAPASSTLPASSLTPQAGSGTPGTVPAGTTTASSLPPTTTILTGQAPVTPIVAPGPGTGPVQEVGFPTTTAVQTSQGIVVIPGGTAVTTTPTPATTAPVSTTVPATITPITVSAPLTPSPLTPAPAPPPPPPPVTAGDTRTRISWNELILPPLTPKVVAEAGYYGGDVLGVLERAANGLHDVGDWRANIQTWNSLRSGNGWGTDGAVLENATFEKAGQAWYTPMTSEEYLHLVLYPDIFWGQIWPRIRNQAWA